MRDIRFRGIHKKTGEWVYGYLVERGKPYLYHIIPSFGKDLSVAYEVFSNSVGQYSGSEDINGVWVYEGDIYEEVKYKKDSVFWIVKWSDRKCGFILEAEIEKQHQGEKYKEKIGVPLLRLSTDMSFKNVGTIYKNPELMENNKYYTK